MSGSYRENDWYADGDRPGSSSTGVSVRTSILWSCEDGYRPYGTASSGDPSAQRMTLSKELFCECGEIHTNSEEAAAVNQKAAEDTPRSLRSGLGARHGPNPAATSSQREELQARVLCEPGELQTRRICSRPGLTRASDPVPNFSWGPHRPGRSPRLGSDEEPPPAIDIPQTASSSSRSSVCLDSERSTTDSKGHPSVDTIKAGFMKKLRSTFSRESLNKGRHAGQ